MEEERRNLEPGVGRSTRRRREASGQKETGEGSRRDDALTQERAPIYEALEAFQKMRVVPFDVPGHKRGRGNPELTKLLGETCMRLDVNSMKPLDNLCHPVSVIADAEQIKRVVNNIVGNSVKYMDKPEKSIQIRVLDVGDFVQVEIEDNGRGISAKDLPYIFDRFYRTDTSRNSSKGGSGIGLSIVHKIMEDHGGKVWATSREGLGTTMYFVLRKFQEVPVNE
mgnify:CR=1 FL=1